MTFQEIGKAIGELVALKNEAYGSSFSTTAPMLKLLYPNGIAPDQYADLGLQFRIWDKMMRIATRKAALGESPYTDIAGYGVLGVYQDQPAPSCVLAPQPAPSSR